MQRNVMRAFYVNFVGLCLCGLKHGTIYLCLPCGKQLSGLNLPQRVDSLYLSLEEAPYDADQRDRFFGLPLGEGDDSNGCEAD